MMPAAKVVNVSIQQQQLINGIVCGALSCNMNLRLWLTCLMMPAAKAVSLEQQCSSSSEAPSVLYVMSRICLT